MRLPALLLLVPETIDHTIGGLRRVLARGGAHFNRVGSNKASAVAPGGRRVKYGQVSHASSSTVSSRGRSIGTKLEHVAGTFVTFVFAVRPCVLPLTGDNRLERLTCFARLRTASDFLCANDAARGWGVSVTAGCR